MIHRKLDHVPNEELPTDRFENLIPVPRMAAPVVTPQEP
jgi:hypothetical protein